MKLSIIIVSYNTKALLHHCLDSLKPQLNSQTEVIIIDNASTDGSVQAIQEAFPKVKLIANKRNLGFAAATNLGIKKTSATYVLLLNPDTLVQPGSLKLLTDYLDAQPQVSIASPKLLNPDGSLQPAGGALPNLNNLTTWFFLLDHLPYVGEFIDPYHQNHQDFYTKTQLTGWVPGTAMIIRRKVLDQIGLLDDQIFMYAEDVDLCLRAHQTDHQVALLPQATVIHASHAAAGKPKALIGEVDGLKYLFAKYKPAWQQLLLRLVFKKGALIRMLLFATIARDKTRYDTYQKIFNLA